MDKPKITAKDFFLWAGAMVALYWSVIAFIFLFFNYIDYAFPAVGQYYPSNPYQSGIGYEMASLIVLFPIYVILMWFIRTDATRDPSRKDIWIRRWALILTLFVAGISIAVDLIEVLTTFFNGESFTDAFLLKALLILLVAACAFMHFMADLWGHWDMYPLRKRSVCVGVCILVVGTIVSGFFIIGTPAQARLYNFDQEKVNDLQTIQSQVVSYWQSKAALPNTLADLNDPISGFAVPVDIQTGQAYEYDKVTALSFKLCATFNAVGDSSGVQTYPAAVGGPQDNWAHEAGHDCFLRTIDPQRYPTASPKPVPAQ
jgi:hypothetical protein